MTRQTDEEMIRDMGKRMADGTEFEGLVPVRARVAKEARAVFAVRLSQAEMKTITEAAAKQARPIGDFIRAASLAAAAGELDLGAAERAAVAAEVKDKLRELEIVASRL